MTASDAGRVWDDAAGGLVSSYAVEDGERVLLIDPLAVPDEIEALASARVLVLAMA